jgi:HK97 family phage portal protein
MLDALAAAFRPRAASAEIAGGLTSEPKAAFGPSSFVSDANGWMIRAMGGGKTESGVAVSEFSAITLPAVYACVSIIADNLAQLPLNVYRSLPGGGREQVTDHPLHAILHDQPNDDMSSFVFRQTVSHHALLWGNGYAEIERTRGGDPVGLWPLFPDRTWPDKPAGSRLRYRTAVNGQSVNLPPEDVLHIPALGFDGLIGYSPVSVARQAVGLGLAAERFGAKFFANDAKSGGFLMHPGKLGDKATGNVAESFQKQGGADNAFKVKVLEEGMKFISTTIPPDDAQFLATREFQVAEIARIFRVPLVLLQSMEKSTSWGSGIEQMMIGFVVWTIQPWLVRWEQEINRKLLTEAERAAGYFVKFNLNALLRGDMKARAAFYKELYLIRAMNPNEVRALEDLNPYEGGEAFYVAPGSEPDPEGDAGGDPDADESPDDPPQPPEDDDDAPPPRRRRRSQED